MAIEKRGERGSRSVCIASRTTSVEIAPNAARENLDFPSPPPRGVMFDGRVMPIAPRINPPVANAGGGEGRGGGDFPRARTARGTCRHLRATYDAARIR